MPGKFQSLAKIIGELIVCSLDGAKNVLQVPRENFRGI